MSESSSPDNYGIVPYQPSTELVRRGLEDLTRALQAVPRFLQVPNEYTTIQDALTHAHAGDTIEVSPGTYAENVVIDKAVTIRAQEDFVELRPARDNEPVLLVQCSHGSIVFENLSIHGNTKVFKQQQVGIRIAQGHIIIRHCRFERWRSLHWDIPQEDRPDPDDDLEYWYNFETSCCIHIDGNDQEVIIEECHFFDCDFGVDIGGGTKVHIVGCAFHKIDSPLYITNSQLVMNGNTFLDGSQGLVVGPSSHIESIRDTFLAFETLLDCASSQGTTVTFSHATVFCDRLIGIAVGDSAVHPAADGKWIWMNPKLVFINSIIELEDDGYSIGYALSADGWGKPEVNIWDAVELLGPNLLFINPWPYQGPYQVDPRLGLPF